MTARSMLALPLWTLQDNLRHAKLLRSLNAIRLWLQASCKAGEDAAHDLSRGLAFSEHPVWDRRLTATLMRRFRPELNQGIWAAVVARLPRYRTLLQTQPQLSRSIILKAPGAKGEKGVLLMLFEYNWAKLALGMSDEDFQWLDQHFDLILTTSWSPTDYATIALLLAKTRGPIFVQPCNAAERSKLADFHPRLVVLDSLSCDWIDPQFYPAAQRRDRDIDFLMVANWGGFKRHWDFFTALRKLPASLKIVLIGQVEGGRDANYIRRLASNLGVPQELEIHQSLPIDKVGELQMQAKVSLIFTRREGCCVAAVESLFAGCALGMRSDAHVGPLEYIHSQTGLRLRPDHLTEDLMRLLEMAPTLTPSEWAADHISCHRTHAKINARLRSSSLERGLPWTKDLALPHWRPYPKLARKSEAAEMQPCYQMLHQKLPRVFGPNLAETSIR